MWVLFAWALPASVLASNLNHEGFEQQSLSREIDANGDVKEAISSGSKSILRTEPKQTPEEVASLKSTFSHYRFKVPRSSAGLQQMCINEMQFYYRGHLLDTPATDCGAPPCASASSIYSGMRPASRAFDGLNLGTGGQGFCIKHPNQHPEGDGWLAYSFPAPTEVDRIRIFFWGTDHSASGLATVKGSHDGLMWFNLANVTKRDYDYLDVDLVDGDSRQKMSHLVSRIMPGEHTHFRYRVPPDSANNDRLCINEMKFYFRGQEVETRNTTCGGRPCGYASSISNVSGLPEFAFDKLNLATGGSGWCTDRNQSNPHGTGMGWLAYEFFKPRRVDQVRIFFWSHDHSAFGHSWLEGSNDGETWKALKRIEFSSGKYDYLDEAVPSVWSGMEAAHVQSDRDSVWQLP
mmetsp:Transcript_51966/g.121681  ORF Transcript_51966/g.121681 Transcript_51966/m.121681 type:complete len:405 (+) Transcript_51966:76-1290(+)